MPSRNACPSLVLQENICLKYTAAGGDNGTKNLVMELENARSHDQQTYAVVFSFIVLCLLLLYPILLHDAATSGVRTPSPITHTHTHTHTHRYGVALTNLSMVAHEGCFLGFLQRNVGENVLSQKPLPAPDGYVAIVCRASSEKEAAHFAEDLRHLVTVRGGSFFLKFVELSYH